LLNPLSRPRTETEGKTGGGGTAAAALEWSRILIPETLSPAPARLDDARRIAALRESGLLDTPPEEAFDRLTRLVTRLLDVPVALVTLVDGDRQFFKSCVGLPEPWATTRQTPLSHSFCQHTVATGRPLVIDDARDHPELRHNLAIPDLGVVAYAGIPLATADGHTLGTFCAIDTRPRHWTGAQIETLRDLAASAATEIELRLALAAARRATGEVERAYREREELLDAATDGIYSADREHRCVFVNRAAAELLGWRPEEMIGRNAHQLFHHSRPDGTPYPEEECPIFRATRTGRPVQVDDEVLWRRDGTPLPVAYASSPVFRGGEAVGAVVRFTDITEQKRATEGLRLLAEAGRLLTASLLDVEETLRAVARMAVPQLAEMAMVDLVEDGCVRRIAASHADERAAALFERARAFPPRLGDGGPQAEVIRTGRPLLVREVDEAWIGSLRRGPEHAEVVRALAPRSLVVVPLRAHEEVLGTLTLVRGAARPPFEERDRELAEELGRRAALAVENARLYDAARRATRARDDMLSVVSHDLRNPVHTVFMSAAFLLEILPEDRQLERGQAAVIKRAAERANRLIQDLLDITRIESGRLVLDRLPQRAQPIADEAIDQASLAAAERGIVLERGETDPQARVDADRDRVLQALGNLIGNALKFTPSGGRVSVSVRGEGDVVRISVADTGPGIPAAQLPRLFDRYWQASGADRRGVGLGLSIVKGIAQAHGGEVRVESVEGAGSTFTLLLPAAREGEAANGTGV
jgi:PAS domain S-box-containing protein